MNRLRVFLQLFLFIAVAVGCTLSHGEVALSEASQKRLTSVAKEFAESHYLGTGAQQFVTSIKPINSGYAIAVLGEWSEGKRYDNAYTVHVKLIKGGWKVVSFDFVPLQTGKKMSEDVWPPFPDPSWKRP